MDEVNDIVSDASGSIYVTGSTSSVNFPVTAEAYDTSLGGGRDAFVAKFDSDGTLTWSTLLGGPNDDRGYAVKVDQTGNVYVAGGAGVDYPTTAGALQSAFAGDINPDPAFGAQDGFITKLSPNGSQIV